MIRDITYSYSGDEETELRSYLNARGFRFPSIEDLRNDSNETGDHNGRDDKGRFVCSLSLGQDGRVTIQEARPDLISILDNSPYIFP